MVIQFNSIKVTVIPIVIGALGTITKELVQGLEDLEIREEVETIPNYGIIKIGQNTEKSAGDLRRLHVSQTPVKDSANAEVKKTLKE